MHSFTCRTGPVILFIFLTFILNASAQKNDTIYLYNGDRITGELKKYENGILVLSTDGMSTLNIEYDKIRTIHSSKYFEIVTTTGFSYFGSILKSATDGNLDIVVTNDTITKAINEIVEIIQIRNRFWKKFYGSIELGLSFYKSTRTLQYYLNTDVNYRARKDLIIFDMSLLFNDQKVNDSTILNTINNDIGLALNHFFQGKWWGGVGVKAQQNTELDLAYRLQLALSGGYDIVHTNPIRFYVMAGALLNREKPTDSIQASTNLEGIVSSKFSWFQYHHPKINITTYINFIPSITVAGRYRLEYNLSGRYELFNDFFISLTFYDNYDSKPSGGESALNDWSVIFSVGYTF